MERLEAILEVDALLLFVRTHCPECVQVDHEALAANGCEIINCDADKEHNLARAIASDVWSFPTLLSDDGTLYTGAKEIKQWITKNLESS